MKNYTYRYIVESMGYCRKKDNEFTERQRKKKEFIEKLSDVVKAAQCGWSGVHYVVMQEIYPDGNEKEYMVLHDNSAYSERWIPISGNSDACNFAVLGENLF